MTTQQNIYHRNKIGWFVEVPGHTEGPMESREEALCFANLLNKVNIARTSEIACTEQECF